MKLNSANINIMVKACRKASKVLIRDFGEIENLQVSVKGPGDFVTVSDKNTNSTVCSEILPEAICRVALEALDKRSKA